MRGKHRDAARTGGETRIIPAHAGQTAAGCARPRPRPDHPRACGANMQGFARGLSNGGSSPRMRGKQRRLLLPGAVVRIIPAHAGQTSAPTRHFPTCSDHPRACGANPWLEGTLAQVGGSSPRMRGKQAQAHELPRSGRIIPAHAGQTRAWWNARARGSDHPRACGANIRRTMSATTPNGSSPRMRGKHSSHAVDVLATRIIPAHAGQTICHMVDFQDDADHPRACGANALMND
ncbi:hypothetical protein PG22506_1227 [Bifidobacterium pseudolongum subsp. globosum]|nr:hypothetical protein PG22506_1227 [Bifidobacterium pseudolongum subsp. globosum]